MIHRTVCLLAVSLSLLSNPAIANDAVETEVLAVADEALRLITAEDFRGLSDLMVEESMSYRVSVGDGVHDLRVTTWEETRNDIIENDFVERGFDPTVLVSGPLATIWYPYDFHSDGQWSHCGVDVFVLGLTEEGWRILSMAWNALQPPECKPHPDGTPDSASPD